MTSGKDYRGQERRGAERVRVNFRARWQNEWVTREGEVADLSTTGCFILTDDLVKAGETVMLELRLPVSGQITVWGRVIHQVEGVGFAVHFSNFMQEEDRRRLGWLVRAEALKGERPQGPGPPT